MLSHVTVGVTDFPRAVTFYSAIMATLGYPLRFSDVEHGFAGWNAADGARPLSSSRGRSTARPPRPATVK